MAVAFRAAIRGDASDLLSDCGRRLGLFVSRLEMWAHGRAQENEQESVQARDGAAHPGDFKAHGQTARFCEAIACWRFDGEEGVFCG
jgi:hypothetical protein